MKKRNKYLLIIILMVIVFYKNSYSFTFSPNRRRIFIQKKKVFQLKRKENKFYIKNREINKYLAEKLINELLNKNYQIDYTDIDSIDKNEFKKLESFAFDFIDNKWIRENEDKAFDFIKDEFNPILLKEHKSYFLTKFRKKELLVKILNQIDMSLLFLDHRRVLKIKTNKNYFFDIELRRFHKFYIPVDIVKYKKILFFKYNKRKYFSFNIDLSEIVYELLWNESIYKGYSKENYLLKFLANEILKSDEFAIKNIPIKKYFDKNAKDIIARFDVKNSEFDNEIWNIFLSSKDSNYKVYFKYSYNLENIEKMITEITSLEKDYYKQIMRYKWIEDLIRNKGESELMIDICIESKINSKMKEYFFKELKENDINTSINKLRKLLKGSKYIELYKDEDTFMKFFMIDKKRLLFWSKMGKIDLNLNIDTENKYKDDYKFLGLILNNNGEIEVLTK